MEWPGPLCYVSVAARNPSRVPVDIIESCSVMVILVPHCLASSSWFQVKRACGQARWADKEDQDGETSAGHHHGDTLASGQQEILSGTITQGHISTGESQCMLSEVGSAKRFRCSVLVLRSVP